MGWEVKTLGEVYDVRDGTHDSPKYVEDGYPLVTSKNLKPEGVTLNNVKYISKEDLDKINKRSKVSKGDVLFAMIGTIGNPTLIINEPNYAIKNVALFKVPNNQSSKFLKYYLESPFVTRKLEKEAKGTTQKFVGLGYLRSFPICCPPLKEQKKIVTILDQAFAEIDKARANAEHNLNNARELFDSYLNQVFSQRGEGWEEKKLGDVCTLQRGFDLPKRLRTKGKHPLLSSSGILDTHNEAKVIGPGVVTGRSGSIGGVFYISEDFWPLNTTLYIKNFHNNNERYIYWLLKALKLERFAGGAGVPTLNRNIVHEEVVFISTDINTQKDIAKRLDNLSNDVEALVKKMEIKIEQLAELKKSILKKAFSGKLT